MAFKDFRQLLSNVYDATNKALKVNVILGGGGGGSTTISGTASLVQSDDFTGASNGLLVDQHTALMKFFSLQIVKTGNVSAWSVVLEGSNDGLNFTTLLSHTDADGDGETIFNTAPSVCAYFRTRCITRTGGTKVTAILGASQ